MIGAVSLFSAQAEIIPGGGIERLVQSTLLRSGGDNSKVFFLGLDVRLSSPLRRR